MPTPRLHVSDEHGRRLVPIDKPVFTIGRRGACDLQVSSADVSRDHAAITYDGVQYVLGDQGSRFGTFVNGEAVVEHVLRHGDRITLGQSDAAELEFLVDDEVTKTGETASGLEAVDLGQIAALLDGLRAVGSGRVVGEVLTRVLDLALDVTRAERGFIMLGDSADALELRIARAQGRVTLSGQTFDTSLRVPREAFVSGRSQFVSDLLQGDLAGAHRGTIALGIRYVLCVPLRVAPYAHAPLETGDERMVGVLYLDGRGQGTLETPATRAALEALAAQAALAIESARLYAEAAEKARIDRDLKIAADIQRALLPPPRLSDARLELAAVSVPCRTIGGDFYDYLELADGRFGLAVADVAGKGAPAALLTVVVQSLFEAQAPIAATPDEVLAAVNRSLLKRIVEARFATMFYGVLEPGGLLRYTNAGHDPPILVKPSGETHALDVGGLVLGLFEHATYACGSVQLEPGDLLLISSDGVTEARSADDEELGRDRLRSFVVSHRQLAPDALLERLLETVRVFAAGAPQADDLTALACRYRGGLPDGGP